MEYPVNQHYNTISSIIYKFCVFNHYPITSPQWLQYQKQKMFWDESWIINYNNIIFGELLQDHTQISLINRYFMVCLLISAQKHSITDNFSAFFGCTIKKNYQDSDSCMVLIGKACYMGFCSTTSLQPVKSNSSISRATDVTVCTVVNTSFKPGFIQPGVQ